MHPGVPTLTVQPTRLPVSRLSGSTAAGLHPKATVRHHCTAYQATTPNPIPRPYAIDYAPPPRRGPIVCCRRAQSASPFCVRRRTGGGGERSWLGAKEATCAGCLMTVSTAIQLSPWLHHPSTRFWAANFIGGGAQEGALKPCAYSNKGWARETCPPAYTKPTHILALY